MDLPVNPPLLPMLAKRADELPPGEDWIFEPKWDGFRALIFRNKDEIFIQSRDEKPLNRYFPELLEPLRSACPRVVSWTEKSSLSETENWTSTPSSFACIRRLPVRPNVACPAAILMQH
jgi:hypothetical protein